MGIFVPIATLPSGITVNNVYMSFTNEVVHTGQVSSPIDPATGKPDPNKYFVSSWCNVYADKKTAKSGVQSAIRFNVNTKVPSLTSSYEALYVKLKDMFPESIDDIIQTPTSNITISNLTLVSLYKDLNSDSNLYVIEEGTSNLVMTVDMASQFADLINSFTFTPAPEPEEKIEATE
jgi:hypothetical protein